jgi:hypothetical protein
MDKHNPSGSHDGTQDRGVPRGDHVVDPAHEGGPTAGTDGDAQQHTGKSGQGGANPSTSDGLGAEVGPAAAREE